MSYIRTLLSAVLSMCCSCIFAQNGYVITNENKLVKGYLRKQIDFDTQREEIEIYKSPKNTEADISYLMNDLKEYAIRNDTFRILRDLAINDWFVIDFIRVRVIATGKLNLFKSKHIANYSQSKHKLWVSDGSPGNFKVPFGEVREYPYYIVEDQDKYLLAVDREDFKIQLEELIENLDLKKTLKSKKFKYKHIPDLIIEYNSR